MTALDTTANNLANAGTTGFKADQVTFKEELLSRVRAGQAAEHMRMTSINAVTSNMTTGPIQVTNNPLDVAIRGDGFFAISTEGGERYTRAGSFRVSADNTLITPRGQEVLGANHAPIQLPEGAGTIEIAKNGTVLVDGVESDSLMVVRFAKPEALQKDGEQMFNATPAAGAPEVVDADLETRALEMANVSVVRGMTDIVSTTRTFEALQKVIETFSEIERRTASGIIGS
jgi:flagellar basal-body rod protein FlgF